MKKTDQIAGRENAGPEFAGPNEGHEIAGHEFAGYKNAMHEIAGISSIVLNLLGQLIRLLA